MATFSFSSFRRTQTTLEVRYNEAYLIWDRAGTVWTNIGRNFKILRNQSATPNQVSFIGDDRFAMLVSLDRASITDHRPQGKIDESIDVFAHFIGTVIGVLNVDILNRIGNRYWYSIECTSQEEARRKARAAVPLAVPKKKLFSIEPAQTTPSFKLEGDDGELAFVAQLHSRELTLDFSPPPQVALFGIEQVEKKSSELTLDVDFSTKKPISAGSFDAKSWLQGWYKTLTREADAFLALVEGRQ